MAGKWRWLVVACCVGGLMGCSGAMDPTGFWNNVTFWEKGRDSDAAMAALQKGDYGQARTLAEAARQRDPSDAYALFTLGEVYRMTGRPDLARQYYAVLIQQRPEATIVEGTGPSAVRRPVFEVARDRLASLYAPPPTAQAVAIPNASPLPPADLELSRDSNVITRFQILQRLLSEGLISREEYDQRRGANLGALLPHVAPPPALGLDRPTPSADEIVQRMKALVVAYQQRGITADAMQAERTIILDALLPANPAKRENPPPAITDQMGIAATVGRLQRLVDAKVITAEEQNRDRDAAMRSLAIHDDLAAAAARAAAGMPAPPPPPSPTGQGVMLASFRTEAQTSRAWAALQKEFPKQLGSLSPAITKLTLRGGAIWYRLNAGPLPDRKAALAICADMRKKRQYCQPTIIK